MFKTIFEHISSILNEMDSSTLSSQRKRHLENELNDLESYQKNHSSDDYDPTPLEIFCDKNPEALECRIYDV
jgi:hypothetical protein